MHQFVRLRAFVLAAIFLAGNFGLPTADTLLDHRRDRAGEERVHLEPLGGCGSHAEHCVLSRLLGDLGKHSSPAAVLTVGITGQGQQPQGTDQRSVPRQVAVLTLSRAPPATRE